VILTVTGHRPKGLAPKGAHLDLDALNLRLLDLANSVLSHTDCHTVVSGMALGVDQAFAIAALNSGRKLIAAIPFRGQESLWSMPEQNDYNAILKRATDIVYVSPGNYALYKFQRRNEWMVDRASQVAAVWCPGSSGGTANCVAYANRRGVPVTNYWKRWVKHSGLWP
jgi:uncharacterized phage-like protein YoqJ